MSPFHHRTSMCGAVPAIAVGTVASDVACAGFKRAREKEPPRLVAARDQPRGVARPRDSHRCPYGAQAPYHTRRPLFSSCHRIAAAPALSTDDALVCLPPNQSESALRLTPHALATSLCVAPSLAM